MGNIAVIIPAYNEEKVLGNTLEKLTLEVSPKDIFVISDASKDKTNEIAKSFGVNLLVNRQRAGKTKNLKKAVVQFKIIEKYEYVFFLDADTYPLPGFFSQILKSFRKKGVQCVCGHVETELKFNIFVSYRSLMYFEWQNIYKSICSFFNSITIAPGTSSVYKTSAISKIDFDEKIIIEDFDMTYQFHRRKLGKMVYNPNAVVITQDPDNLKDYFRQITRWETGYFQSWIKHGIPFGFQPFEIAILILTFLEIIHSALLLFIVPLFFWVYFLKDGHTFVFGLPVESSALLALISFEVWLVWGFALLHAFYSKRFYNLIFGPFLWLLQYVTMLAYAKAIYLTVFRSINGAWTSPRRRLA